MVGWMLTFFIVTFGLAFLGFWIYALVDAIRSNFQQDSQKVIWILLLLLVPLIGMILYFTLGLQQKLPEDDDWDGGEPLDLPQREKRLDERDYV